MISNIPACEGGAYVYHDGHAILGISFVADAALEAHPHFRIPVEVAADFIQGTKDHRKWFVWINGDHQGLYNDITKGITLDNIGDDYQKIGRADINFGLLIKIYSALGRVSFQAMTNVAFTSTLTDDLVFIFTAVDDPSAVLQKVRCSIQDILKDQVVVEVNHVGPMDVYCREVFPGYALAYAEPGERLTLRLPQGHFVDLMRFSNKPIDQGLQITVFRNLSLMEVMIVGAHQEYYNRSMDWLQLVFSKPDDPTLILHAMSIPMDDLREQVYMEIPRILEQPFSVWSRLFFSQASVVEI
jgi:hypothetical protein